MERQRDQSTEEQLSEATTELEKTAIAGTVYTYIAVAGELAMAYRGRDEFTFLFACAGILGGLLSYKAARTARFGRSILQKS